VRLGDGACGADAVEDTSTLAAADDVRMPFRRPKSFIVGRHHDVPGVPVRRERQIVGVVGAIGKRPRSLGRSARIGEAGRPVGVRDHWKSVVRRRPVGRDHEARDRDVLVVDRARVIEDPPGERTRWCGDALRPDRGAGPAGTQRVRHGVEIARRSGWHGDL
jgi:hypothetical protein